jgi:hypothetical protein
MAKKMPRPLIDLTGKVFGRLTVIKRHSTNCGRMPRWACLCECGNDTTVQGGHLRRWATSKEQARNRRKKKRSENPASIQRMGTTLVPA